MAGESDSAKAVDKGKGKAVEDPKKDKAVVNGKKEDEKAADGRSLRWTQRVVPRG
jgi:26S proteasome regulatory subunit N1